MSDNGPQYSSNEFNIFANNHNFGHVTSSPLFPLSNGQVESAMQAVKKLLKRSDDPCMTLLTSLQWSNFHLWNYS